MFTEILKDFNDQKQTELSQTQKGLSLAGFLFNLTEVNITHFKVFLSTKSRTFQIEI